MKKILLHEGNRERIDEALRQVNGRATAHTVTSATQLARIAAEIEAILLRRGATKKSLMGTQVTYTPPGPGKTYAKSAKQVLTTTVVLERGPSHWGLVTAARHEIWADSSQARSMRLPPAALEKIAEAALGDLDLIGSSNRPYSDLLRRALKIVALPCGSAHEKLALLKALEEGGGP